MYWPNFLRKQLAWITSNGPIEHSVYIDCFHCHIKIERMLLNYYIFAIHLYILSVVQTCKDVVRVKAKALFPSMKKITHRVNWWLASSMLNCLLLMFFFLNLRFICCVFYYLLILLCFCQSEIMRRQVIYYMSVFSQVFQNYLYNEHINFQISQTTKK